jgi:tRNA pseudouridine32 synthase / 23S rRNA pseudouridine746 synthase
MNALTILPEILYQDEDILAINKPAGLLSIPDGYDRSLPHVAGVFAAEFGKVWIVHRLDRETSGLLLLARSPAAHRELNLQFEHRQVKKIYHAIIVWQPEWDAIQTDAPLCVNADRKHRTRVSPINGKPAQTNFRVLQRFRKACLIEAQPQSGYTHQIRAHLADLGFPIFQDWLYANSPGVPSRHPDSLTPPAGLINRVALHARSISIIHPMRHTPLDLEAPYPADFLAVLQWMKD